MVDDIARCELRYRDGADKALSEEALLEILDRSLPALVYAFDSEVPPPRERGGYLALEQEYDEWRKTTSGDPEARRSAVIRSFLAVETERRGQFQLSRSQNGRIAALYDAIGEEFFALGMPRHAALAFQGAADLYVSLQQKSQRVRSLLNWRRAQHEARPRGVVRLFDTLYDATCGYGYRPFRMLGWMGLLLAVFSVVVWLCGRAAYIESLHACLIDFLNPLGLGDLNGVFSGAAQVLLTIESFIGTIGTALFFAFLVRD